MFFFNFKYLYSTQNKGNFSFDLNLVSQLAVMNGYDPHAITQNMASFVKHPIVTLNDTAYDYKTCQRLVRLQINYLINRHMLDTKFTPNQLVSLALPLRNEKVFANVIEELIAHRYFDILCHTCQNDVESIAVAIVHVLCNFVYVKNVINVVNAPVLPPLPSLNAFLSSLVDFQQKFLRDLCGEDMELVENGFPPYNNITELAKNSYILGFYLTGDMRRVCLKNKISETTLYYAIKTMCVVLSAINNLVGVFEDDSLIKRAFIQCEDTMTKRFKLIRN